MTPPDAPLSTLSTKLALVASGVGGQLLWMRPDESTCGDLTLDWVWLEPLASGLGVKAWFQDHGPLAFFVPLAPAGLGALAVITLLLGLRELARAREHQHTPLAGLVVLGIGAWTGLVAAWGVFWWLAL